MPKSDRRSWTIRVTPRLVVLTTVLALLTTLLGAGPAFAAGTLSVVTTAYSPATPTLGSPVLYVARTSIGGGYVTSNIVVTQTTPTGVRPLAASAPGFVCGEPSGQTISCTTTNSFFYPGENVSAITVVAIVTGSITAAAIRSTSSTTVRATGSTSGSDTAMDTGTLPAAPTGVAVNPAVGPIAGGNTVTVTGANIVAAKAVEIGTTAELQAGTPVTLLRCANGVTSNCFTVSGSSLLVYVPPRSSPATVSVTVVDLGVSGAANYVYADKPAAPATPTATAGITSATVTWSAPAANGSAITGYLVTPIRDGVAQQAISFGPSGTSRTLTGLTAGSSYTFTVAATNAIGTSAPSNPSAAVVPYGLSAAPSITSATAGTLSATLTWTAPNNGGSAITAYRVIPYISGVAQTAQTFSGSSTTQQVTGLTAGTAYTFTVAAQNAAGTGPASAPSPTVTPNAAPTLNFAAPPAGRVGVAYSYQLTVNGGTSPFSWALTSGSLPAGVTLSSTGLLSGTPTASGTFDLTVQVTDASGSSASRAVKLLVTDKPSVPAAPTARAGLTSAVVTWTAPDNNGTAITRYVITPYLDGAAQAPVDVDPSAKTRTLNGLTAGGRYTFTVAAVNATGTSAASGASNAVVPYAALSAPVITAVAAGSSSATLSWTAPTSTGGSAITGYVVTPYIGAAAQPAQTFAGPATTQTVTGLTPGAVYSFRVAATNLSGTNVLYRVNAGGPALAASDGGPGWAADNSSTNPLRNTGSSTASYPSGAAVDNTVPSTTPSPLFDAERSGDMRWAFPVSAGANVTVRLYFANQLAGTSTVGARVFDVDLDGSRVLPGLLDDAGYAGDGASDVGAVTYGAPELSWTGDLAVGATATLTWSVRVDDPDGGDRELTTSVSSLAPGSSCEVGSPCVNTVTVLIPGLAVSTTADVSTATPGDRVSFTIRLENTGQTSYTGTTLSTALDQILDDATFDGGVSASSGVASYAAPNLTWTGSLAVGSVVIITYQVIVSEPDRGDKMLSTTVLNTSAGSTCSTESANPSCTATVAILFPGLSISKTANTPTTTPGGIVSYTIVLTNTGETPYTGASISDSLADVLTEADYNGDAVVATGGGGVSYAAPVLSWAGDLLVGASASITYSVTVHQVPTGDKVFANTVVSTAPGSTCPPNSTLPACTAEVRVLIPALRVTKTADRSSVVAGSAVQYTVTLTNTGETDYAPATFTDPLTDVLDDASYAGDAVVSTGTIDYVNDTLAWTGALAVGASATIVYSVTTDYPAQGDRSLLNQVYSDSAGANCSAGATDPVCSTDVTVLVPALTLSKTADTAVIVAGGTVRYTIEATNTGEADYAAASLVDPLTGVLDDAVYNGDAVASTGTLDYAADTLSWTGDLDIGESVQISYSVTADLVGEGDASLVNGVTSIAVGSSCPAAGSSPACVSTVAVEARVIEISDLTPAFTLAGAPGATVEKDGAVGLTVTTNSAGGYAVTVQAADEVLTGSDPGNPDSIPIAQLGVRGRGQSAYTPLSQNPFAVHTSTGPSGPGGDAVASDYQIQIPFVASDTYSTTLEYIVTAQ